MQKKKQFTLQKNWYLGNKTQALVGNKMILTESD